ncbi:MAG: DUF1523 domain-containing protein [Deltaproteobacteria bacterium]|nr:MAG: DUF1523 domain-containing protein [Deltaproteobacteria bacterium]
MKTTKKIKIGIGIVLIVVIALFFHYNLPRTAVVQISGTDIKRVDKPKDIKVVENETDEQKKIEALTKDVRFINSVSRKDKPMVFLNQDTGWGWPPYFKFDSADLTAEAQAFATDQSKPWVLVKYYGWRFTLFSMFPNVLDLKQVDRNYTHIPLFNIVFIILVFVLIFVIRIKFKKLATRIRDRNKSNREA